MDTREPRLRYATASLSELFEHPLLMDELETFLSYVVSPDRDGRGRVDLVARPRSAS